VTASARATAAGALFAIPAGVLAGLLAILGAEMTPLVPVVALAAIAVGSLALLRPILAIYLAVLLIPLQASTTANFSSFGISPTELIVVVAAGGWLTRKLASGGEFPSSRLVPPLLAVLAVHIPGLFLAVDQFAVFKQMFMWSAMFVLFIAVLDEEDASTTQTLAAVIAAAGAMVAAVAIYKSFGTSQIVSDQGGIVSNRAVGPFTSPVHLGMFIVITVPMQVVFMIRGRSRRVRLCALGATALSLTALVLTLSRSAFVAITAALIWIVVAWRPARQPALIVAMILTAVLLTGFNPAPSVFNPRVIEERIASITSPDTDTAQKRFQIWRKVPEIVKENFPFGIGPKNLPVRAPEYGLVFPEGAPSNAHNTFLIVATELGVPGVLVLIWLVIAFCRILARGMRFAKEPDRSFAIGLSGSFLALVVDGFTGYSYDTNAFALVVFLLAATAARIERGARSSPQAPTSQQGAERVPEPESGLALA
jgi:hypothetical protein